MMQYTIWLFLLLTLAATSAVRADSEGYFCTGPGYVAYQFGMAAPPVAPHRLYIVRYGNGAISEPMVYVLPQFQVHGMQCLADAVHLLAYDALHTVTLDSLGKPVRASSVPLPERNGPPSWARESRNLARLSPAAYSLMPERYSLGREPNGHEYALLVTATPDSIRECPPTITSRIVEFDRDLREVRARTLFQGTGGPPCSRISLAPTNRPARPMGKPSDVLLDALVFGVREPIDVSLYSGDLQREFETYLRRADAYRTTRPPVGAGEMQMVDAARVDYERRLAAIARDTGMTALAVAYVDSLRPCYEWEGFHDCPERDALFADAYQVAHPDGPLSGYLPLLSAHRWLCAAEAFNREDRASDAARSRRLYVDRLAVAQSSRVLLLRTAAMYLAQRGRCVL